MQRIDWSPLEVKVQGALSGSQVVHTPIRIHVKSVYKIGVITLQNVVRRKMKVSAIMLKVKLEISNVLLSFFYDFDILHPWECKILKPIKVKSEDCTDILEYRTVRLAYLSRCVTNYAHTWHQNKDGFMYLKYSKKTNLLSYSAIIILIPVYFISMILGTFLTNLKSQT